MYYTLKHIYNVTICGVVQIVYYLDDLNQIVRGKLLKLKKKKKLLIIAYINNRII